MTLRPAYSTFELPPPGDGSYGPWRRWIDTSLDSPRDIVPWHEAAAVEGIPKGPAGNHAPLRQLLAEEVHRVRAQ